MGSTRLLLTRRSGWLILAALAIIPMASCGESGPTSVDASSELSAAVDRMASLRSVRIVEHSTGPDTTNDIVTIDFEPPDRAHTVQTGADSSESFYIGSTVFQAEPGRPGYFRTIDMPASSGGPRNLLSLLHTLKGAGVTKQGDAYRLTAPGGAESISAKVHGGYITEFVVVSGGVRSVQEFTLFDKAPAVVQPPADRVLPPIPEAPECEPGQPPPMICLNPGPGTSEEPLELPALPPDFTASDLQIRPVVGDGTGCTSQPRNPETTSTVRLNDSSGRCYELGAAELTITQAKAIPVRDQFSEAINVNVELDEQDAATFNQVAHRHLGNRVAIVMFGRVLATSVVQTDDFQGRGQISGLDAASAAEVIASLSK